MKLSADQLIKHIKKHGITKVRVLHSYREIPAGTILYFGCTDNYVSTWTWCTGGKNNQLNYDFDYCWSSYWHIEYKGLFELVDYEEEHNFQWAIVQLNQGKKVRRKIWDKTYYLILKNNQIYYMAYKHTEEKRCEFINNISHYEATDWELFKEKDREKEDENKYEKKIHFKTLKDMKKPRLKCKYINRNKLCSRKELRDEAIKELEVINSGQTLYKQTGEKLTDAETQIIADYIKYKFNVTDSNL